mgnify:CR=1 FL=1
MLKYPGKISQSRRWNNYAALAEIVTLIRPLLFLKGDRQAARFFSYYGYNKKDVDISLQI